MKIFEWLRPGINIKRWFLLAAVGILSISYGLSYLIWGILKAKLQIISSFFAVILILSGIYFIYVAIKYGLGTLFSAIKSSGFNISLDREKLTSLLVDKRILIKGPKIVVIGGGTGLSTMLRGLKKYSSNITAVVTVADDGGGSGMLRQDLGILPPGDIRNCILALADTEPIMEKLLQYRFTEGALKGQNFGNLFLAAMDGISENFEDAVKKMSDVLAVTGKVIPVTLTNVTLCAELNNGHIVKGESVIGKKAVEENSPIKKVFLEPANVEPVSEVLEAIKDADIIVLGPGSLYTSVIPNLLVKGIPEAIEKSSALKVYVCNVMEQRGETDDFKVSDHIRTIFSHSKPGIIEFCIINGTKAPEELIAHYQEHYNDKKLSQVFIDEEEVLKLGVKTIKSDVLSVSNNLIRHDPEKLSEAIVEILADNILSKDKKRVVDYFYVKDRLRKLAKNSG